jgi:hypothetical protein
MNEEKKPFTVNDRRHFTADGLARGETPAEPAGAPLSVPPKAAEASQSESVAAPHPEIPPASEADPVPEPQSEPMPGDAPGTDFGGFLLSLAAQASMLLSPDPQSGSEAPEPAAARHFIAIFEMLRDKTEGHRTPEEEQLLEGILYELRMAYLEASRPRRA